MSAPYRHPARPEAPRKRGHGLTVALGATGALLWLGVLTVVFSMVGLIAMILAYAMLHGPHSSPSGHGGDAGAPLIDAARD